MAWSSQVSSGSGSSAAHAPWRHGDGDHQNFHRSKAQKKHHKRDAETEAALEEVLQEVGMQVTEDKDAIVNAAGQEYAGNERKLAAQRLKSLSNAREKLDPCSQKYAVLTSWIEEEKQIARNLQSDEKTKEELMQDWASAKVVLQRAQKQMRLSSAQLAKAETSLMVSQDAFRNHMLSLAMKKAPDAMVVAGAYASVLHRLSTCTHTNGDGSVTVAEPSLLDTLVGITAKLATVPLSPQQKAQLQQSDTDNGWSLVTETNSDSDSADQDSTSFDDSIARFLRSAHRSATRRRQSAMGVPGGKGEVSGSRGTSPSSVREQTGTGFIPPNSFKVPSPPVFAFPDVEDEVGA